MIDSLTELESICKSCQKCPLSQTRTNVVFGTGNTKSEIMFIGEGPGENEDLQGLPFVGKAGQLLDKYLAAAGLSREKNVYIANIVKCRPPQNRDPKPEEAAACIGYLRNQTAIIRPKVIVCLGRIAACQIIDKDFKVTRQHGMWFERNGTFITATFHPAALLRNPQNKPEAFDDFMIIREKLLEVSTSELYK
ncbi:MAG: uracil-DNA glycosylase [Oscillospiraceae bacterium]|nr:uracil-DNA glycosylase [Oscillospiraceae bacterium]